MHATPNFLINQSNPSKAFDDRIKFLILHYTAQDFQTSLGLLQDKVSSHYLISDDAEIFQLVDENKRAWHAGDSYFAGRTNLNDSSIGIEIVNLDGNKNPYPHKQIEAVIFLCQKIVTKYDILPRNVLAHSDIAPLRKMDPGALFPWNKLYQNGVGAMPDEVDIDFFMSNIDVPNVLELQNNLVKYGYKIDITEKFDEQTKIVVDAFRRHFCPDLLGGEFDKKTYATLLALIKKYVK